MFVIKPKAEAKAKNAALIREASMKFIGTGVVFVCLKMAHHMFKGQVG